MLGLDKKDTRLLLLVTALIVFAPFLMNPFPENSAMAQFNAGYPDLMQRFAIFAIFAIGFNILFGLTGYLSFGHAAFLGIGSYSAVWMFKLLSMNVIPAIIAAVVISGLFSVVVGYLSLRRTGIYFSILTLAFAQMAYSLAFSVLSPITNGETGLQITLRDPRILGASQTADGSIPVANLFGLSIRSNYELSLGGWIFNFGVGYYLCGVIMLISFYVAIRIFRSPFGLMLRAVKTNQNRMKYSGLNTKPYTLSAFVISGMYAGLAGGLMSVVDPLAGAERMQWTASGEVVLMTIFGGAGTLMGPILGSGFIKYLEAILSKINDSVLQGWFAFMPDGMENFFVAIINPFVGKGWHLTLGTLFMIVVIFLPGGLMEGAQRIGDRFKRRGGKDKQSEDGPKSVPAE